MTAPVRVAHLTSVHPTFDTRIFHKECATLAAAGYDVSLVVAGGTTAEEHGVHVVGVPRATGRVGRAALGTIRVGRAAWRTGASVFHFHDPELLPLGLALRLTGRKVVYDAHEWVKGDVGSKPYLAPWLAKLLGATVGGVEQVAARVLTHTVAATPFIASQFPAGRTTVVGNFPDLRELDAAPPSSPDERVATRGVYIGGLNDERCGPEILAAVTAARAIDPRLHLVMGGSIDDGLRPQDVDGIEHRGMLNRTQVVEVMNTAAFGLVLLRPLPNCIDALPTKFFEYLAAGVPAIVSRTTVNIARITEEVGCGLVVEGEDPASIARAMVQLAADPAEARAMGERGAVAVRERYNWSPEGAKLVALYDRITGR